MGVIPHYFKTESETYITVPAMRQFIREIDPDKAPVAIRSELIEIIENYAQISEENAENVRKWVDDLCRQGIIELRISSLEFDMSDLAILQDNSAVKKMISAASQSNSHITTQKPTRDFRIFQCCEKHADLGKIISVALCKTVFVLPSSKNPYTLSFPVFIDIYVDKSMLIVRGKSKSTLYDYVNGTFNIDINGPLTLDNLLSEALNAVREISGLKLKVVKDQNQLKHRLYRLLDKFTATPPEIECLMQQNEVQIANVAKLIKQDICNLTSTFEDDVLWDVKNLVEKYFSISHSDKSIFTKNREAYPLKLIAKDDEDSKVEQTSALSEPLQSKAIFFDNKKMMQKSLCCEGVLFVFRRLDPLYFGKEYKVSFEGKPKWFAIKFHEYTLEVDIQHVLVSLFGTETENEC